MTGANFTQHLVILKRGSKCWVNSRNELRHFVSVTHTLIEEVLGDDEVDGFLDRFYILTQSAVYGHRVNVLVSFKKFR